MYTRIVGKTLKVNTILRLIKLLLSGDIEMNPGPTENVINKSICFSPEDNSILLTTRLHRHGLRPLDVGVGGDCFFRAVAHQLYGDPNFHLNIRALGVDYLREHPERFIESNSENSWLEYLACHDHSIFFMYFSLTFSPENNFSSSHKLHFRSSLHLVSKIIIFAMMLRLLRL